jgi:hypothetical protein
MGGVFLAFFWRFFGVFLAFFWRFFGVLLVNTTAPGGTPFRGLLD